jgi:translation initiation factor 4G
MHFCLFLLYIEFNLIFLGMLLRWFVSLYEADIVDEHVFLDWKEDVNDSYPGKGKALFQVNHWLTWLEEAESEEEDEDED